MPDEEIVGIHNFSFFVETFFGGTLENCNNIIFSLSYHQQYYL